MNTVSVMPRKKPSNAKPLAFSYIRFSTLKQASGDSFRRQSEAADEWAQRHGLKIVESYEDLGISAFKGAHAAHGHLARFLNSVRGGAIPVGSYLIVESLDRLSRADIPEALSQFLEIIRAGIVVVTLMDEKVYTRESIARDISDIMISLVIMSRANEESRSKAKRSTAVWEARRRAAVAGKVERLGVGPAWLTFDEARSGWVADESKAKTVRELFELYAGGMGVVGIVKKFNRERRPVIGASDGWHPGYIRLLLSNRAVLGEKVFYKMEGGKREIRADIEPVGNYYPQIVEPALFAKVQNLRNANPGVKGRRAAENIFRGLITTPKGDSVAAIGRNSQGKRKRYLIPSRSFRGIDPYMSWRYDDFRDKFLFLIRAASERPLPKARGNPLIGKLENDLAETKEQIGRALDVLVRVSSPEMETKLRDLESRKQQLESKLEELTIEAQAQTALRPLREIDWGDDASLSSNIRATVRKITLDIPARAFSVLLFDGRTYSYEEEGSKVRLTVPENEPPFTE